MMMNRIYVKEEEKKKWTLIKLIRSLIKNIIKYCRFNYDDER